MRWPFSVFYNKNSSVFESIFFLAEIIRVQQKKITAYYKSYGAALPIFIRKLNESLTDYKWLYLLVLEQPF